MGQRLKKGSPKLRSRSPRQTVEALRLALRRERARHREALEQQTATAEILRVISSSPTALRPVLDAILEKATHLCDAHLGVLNLFEGESCRTVAQRGGSPEFAKWVLGRGAFKPAAAMARVLADRRPFHVPDARQGPGYQARNANAMKFVDLGGVRTYLAVPLLKEGAVIGSINIFRPEVRPFTDKQIALVSTFANQAVIAIENTRLFNETQDALERQTATADILKVIAASPADTQPVFDAIVKTGVRLFHGMSVSLRLVKGDQNARVAFAVGAGSKVTGDTSSEPTLLNDRSISGRAILRSELVHSADVMAEEWLGEQSRIVARRMGYRSVAAAPMLREGKALGVIGVTRADPGTFSDKELALLRTFADQAVIAIENVRLFNETKEALERQTATAEILRVISSSPTDVQPVFDVIARSAGRVCNGLFTAVFRFDGKLIHLAAHHGTTPEGLAVIRRAYPRPPGNDTLTARAVLERAIIQIAEGQQRDVPAASREMSAAAGRRSGIVVPMLRDGEPLGTISVGRSDETPFTPSEVALLKTFADQAVIAIENVRLFNELQSTNSTLREALEQQTATADILKVISGSPTDVQPVFETIIRNAVRLGGADMGAFFRFDGELVHLGAHHNLTPQAEALFRKAFPQKLSRDNPVTAALVHRAPVNVPDIQTSTYSTAAKERGLAVGHRSILTVPLMRAGVPIGTIGVGRREPGPYSDSYVALLKTFADQAVIAIENVRLFNETKEALDQQMASAEVLGAISSSIADARPVFEKIVESCERLFAGLLVGINVVGEDGLLRLGASRGGNREALGRIFPMPVDRNSGSGCAMLECRVMHYPDSEADDVPLGAKLGTRANGGRSVIFAPMLWEGRGIGAVWVARAQLGGFTEKEIALLKTFADQAVIAIQNARLFKEIQEKSVELEVANRQLEVANKHKSDFLANMSHELRTPLNAIIGFSEVMIEQMFGELNEKQLDYQKDIHESGKHLLSLINDILDLSKIEAGRMELELSSFHLPTAVSNAVTLIRERAQRHGIALGVEVDPRLGDFQADERKVKQILLNLLSNAVKFTPDGGRVDVTAKLDTDKVAIAVKDTGVGIAPADQASLFEEFKQFGNDRSRKAEGTGLGLALTRRLVELHGGQILVDSAVGQGSTFRVLLPVRH